MSLREAVEADDKRPGGNCPVRVLVAGDIPGGSTATDPLEADDRAFLAQATTPGSQAVLTKIHRYLIAAGYKVGATGLQAHRRGDCGCRA